jgi:hypothetical protein
MNLEQALALIEEGLNIAARKGAFNMKEAKFLQDAYDVVKAAADPNSKAPQPRPTPPIQTEEEPAPKKRGRKAKATA